MTLGGAIDVTPATPTIGAFVTDVDLREPLGVDVVDAIRTAWFEHQVLFFRDQHLSIEQQKRFASQFGELWIHPYLPAPDDHPEVLVVRTKPGRKAPGEGWHTDMSPAEEPPSASILRLERVPATGGDTMFASMYAAWDALSDHWKGFLEPLDAWHSSAQRHGVQFGGGYEGVTEYPRVLHPIARTHPGSGRTALYVNQGFTMEIDGMTAAESRATLDFLFRHIEQPSFHVRLQWEPGTIAMWDNRCVQHNAINDYDAADRLGYRVTLTGERPRR